MPEKKQQSRQHPRPCVAPYYRREIMRLYNFTCAACCLRIINLNGASAVDAARIVPFADSRDDGSNNGLALSKLHH